MNRHQLQSHWHVDAPIEAVWEALYNAEDWPKWWPSVIAVRTLAPGDAQGVGAVRLFTWGSAFPYQLSFQKRTTRVHRPYLLEGVVEGDLSGTGRWSLSPSGASTAVSYDWEVSTTRTWMNVMAPFLGPMFRWNHGKVMAAGAQGLNAWLRARGAARPR